VVEQAVGEVVGSGLLAQAGDRGGEGDRGVAVGAPLSIGQSGADQIPFGPQHGGDVAGLVGIEQVEQFPDGRGVA